MYEYSIYVCSVCEDMNRVYAYEGVVYMYVTRVGVYTYEWLYTIYRTILQADAIIHTFQEVYKYVPHRLQVIPAALLHS